MPEPHVNDSEFLSGKRVLVVEDEYVIASDLARRLKTFGVEVAGPAATVDQAMTLAKEPLDAAVLDINLRDQLAYRVANELERNHVPFVFTTGYEKATVSEEFTHVRTLEKPVAFEQLASALVQVMSGGGGSRAH